MLHGSVAPERSDETKVFFFPRASGLTSDIKHIHNYDNSNEIKLYLFDIVSYFNSLEITIHSIKITIHNINSIHDI